MVVDEDVDIRDAQSREWVLNFRVRPEHDIHILPVTMALLMDPSAGEDVPLHDRRAAKVFIDATKKSKYPAVALPPRSYLDKVQRNWQSYGLPEVDFSWIEGLRR
jgi:3-polyprenyl-4-hydroxybenzoate decarboxylase